MCNLCYKHMFAIIVAVSNNFHIMYIKDGKEKYISNSAWTPRMVMPKKNYG